MRNMKRILAWIGIIILVAMYVATLIVAIVDHTHSMMMFKGAVGLTIVIPILIWFYIFLYQIITGHRDDNKEASGAADINASAQNESDSDSNQSES